MNVHVSVGGGGGEGGGCACSCCLVSGLHYHDNRCAANTDQYSNGKKRTISRKRVQSGDKPAIGDKINRYGETGLRMCASEFSLVAK